MDNTRRDLVSAHNAGNDGVNTLQKALGQVEFDFRYLNCRI